MSEHLCQNIPQSVCVGSTRFLYIVRTGERCETRNIYYIFFIWSTKRRDGKEGKGSLMRDIQEERSWVVT